MKYNLKITGLLVGLFLLSQLVGLGILYQDIQVVTGPSGGFEAVHPETAIGERPDVEGSDTVVFILSGVLLGTLLLLVIIKFAKANLWRILFFIAVITTTTVALGVFIDPLIAFVIALILTIVKVFRSNIVIHNVTELLVYAGIAVVFVPLFNIEWAIVLLLIISAYDAFAVWQSKHMITMAKFQTRSSLFAGLLIGTHPGKTRSKKKTKASKKGKGSGGAAILGGGDIAFPLIFSGVVLESLIVSGLTKATALFQTLIIPIVLAIVIFILLVKGEQGKFYPAMPFLTIGCLLGWGLLLLL